MQRQKLKDCCHRSRPPQAKQEQGSYPYYNTQSEGHWGEAKNFLIASMVLAAATVGLGIWLFSTLHVDLNARAGTEWAEFTRSLVVRLFFVGIATYALTFCVRGYRIGKHLQVVNEQKRNALDTYSLFTAAITSDTLRDVVTAELVKAVFASSDTGYLSETQDRTVVENQGSGILSLLLNRTGNSSA